MLAGLLTVRSSLGVRHLGDLRVDWWLVEQHSSPRSADVALAYCVRNGTRMAIDSVTPWMQRPFQVTRVTGPPHPGLVSAAVPLRCSTAWGRTAPGGRRWRRKRRGASDGAALGRGGAVARFSVLCGGAAGSSPAQSAAVLSPARDARLRLPPSPSAGAVTPTGGCLPVVRFALRRRRRGLRVARSPPGVTDRRGPQRPRRMGAPPLAGGGGGGNDGVLPTARRWGAAAPLQDFRFSAAAPPDQARPSRRPSFPGGVGRIPRLPEQRAGNVRVCCRRSSRRRCRMLSALTRGPRPGPFSWAAGSFAAAPSAAVFRLLFCASMRCGRSPSCGADAEVSDGEDVGLRQGRCTGGCGRWCAEAGWSVACSFRGVPLRLVSALGARARVSSSTSHVLTAGRVNPDRGVSYIGGNYLHRRYLAARDRAS